MYSCEINETSAQGLLREERSSNACEQMGGIYFDTTKVKCQRSSQVIKTLERKQDRCMEAHFQSNALVIRNYDVFFFNYDILPLFTDKA